MLGLVIDIAMIGIIVAVAWVGSQLGMMQSMTRAIAVTGAVITAALLRDPAGAAITWATPLAGDSAGVVGMMIVGVGVGLALTSILRWYGSFVSDDSVRTIDPYAGAVWGVILGSVLAAGVISLLVLIPSRGPLTSAAITSRAGHLMIGIGSPVVRWVNTAFPTYTQTLPKGPTGAQTSHHVNLSISSTADAAITPDTAGELVGQLNAWRIHNSRLPFTWNPEIARAAGAHSRMMMEERFLDTREHKGGVSVASGTTFARRMELAIGGTSVRYTKQHVFVVWAHSPSHAFRAITHDRRLRSALADSSMMEIGVGAAQAGWFNGTMFTIGMVGRTRTAPA